MFNFVKTKWRKKRDQSSGDGAVVVGRRRKKGFYDHGIHAGVDVFGGDLAAVSRSRRYGLAGINGSDESELRQVILVGPDTWEGLVV